MSHVGLMKIASITEAKNNLSALIDRGHPVARLEPVVSGRDNGQDPRLSRLLREGLVRTRRTAPLQKLFDDEPPRAEPGASAVAALLEERREGR